MRAVVGNNGRKWAVVGHNGKKGVERFHKLVTFLINDV